MVFVPGTGFSQWLHNPSAHTSTVVAKAFRSSPPIPGLSTRKWANTKVPKDLMRKKQLSMEVITKYYPT